MKMILERKGGTMCRQEGIIRDVMKLAKYVKRLFNMLTGAKLTMILLIEWSGGKGIRLNLTVVREGEH